MHHPRDNKLSGMKIIKRTETARRHLDRRFREAGDVRRHLAVPVRGWIKAIRESLGMTASQLAMRMGVSQSTLSDMEKAEERGGPTLRFKLYAPAPGFYRLYAQTQIMGEQKFAPFNVTVAK